MSQKWRETILGEAIALLRNGLNCNQDKSGFGEKISRIETISAGCINQDKVGYAKLTKNQKNLYKIKQGDILFSHINSNIHVGKTAYIDNDIDIYHGMNLLLVRASNEINPRFLDFYFKKLFWSGYWTTRCKQSVNQASVNQKDIKKTHFSYPPLPEQKRIVAILDKAFAGIDKAIANTEKNLTNARELFTSYLEKVFALDDGSHQVTLSEIATHVTDGDHMPPPKASEGIPFITISNINKHTREIDFSDTFKVPEVYFRNLKISRKPKNGDILYTVTGSYGIPVRVPVGVRFCFQRHIGLIRPKVGVNSTWLYYALLSPSVLKQATDGATGTAQKTVSLKVLRGIRLPNVSQAEQVLIAQKSDTLWGKVQRLESIYQQKLKALSELKQSFLQKAFSGELTSDTVQ